MQIPFNFRTAAFAVIMGFALSVPVGLMEHIILKTPIGYVQDPPQWLGLSYVATALLSMLLLPFWSGFALKDQPVLRHIGWRTFYVLFIFFCIALFFPKI